MHAVVAREWRSNIASFLLDDGAYDFAKNYGSNSVLNHLNIHLMPSLDDKNYQIVEKNLNLTPEEIIKKVIAGVDDWMDEQYDDISIAVIKKV